MSDLIVDVLAGRVGYRDANAICNAGGKMLKVVEMTHRYGRMADKAADPAPMLDIAPAPKSVE